MARLSLILVAAGFAAIALMPAAAAPRASTDKDVRVINTPAEPVPVVGNVGVVGTPTVGLSPSANTVNIAMPTSPLPVQVTEVAPRQPVQVFKHVEPLPFDLEQPIYTVPAGKRLVVEYVSTYMVIPVGSGAFANITTEVGGTTARHYLPMTEQTTYDAGTTEVSVGQQLTRLYADPGTTVVYEVHRNTGSLNTETEISFSGYLVDA